IDVGADRPNLFFHTRVLQNTDNPVLDALNLLPAHIDDSTPHEDVPKCLFYFNSEGACRDAVDTLRKCLPDHLRDCVYPFSSDMSETGKQKCWDRFGEGIIRIVCATDAAGMGCSIPDVKYSVIFGLPSSLSVVIQRWGRAGRDRTTPGVCLLLV
ncbi:P-loop containing nucleoside triphosphate hydrolase protein, partial [Rhodocollybia butyracea]